MYLTHVEFLKRVEASNSKYWQEGKSYRWTYMDFVIQQLKQICPDDSKLIEAGTSGMPLSDCSTLYEYPECDLNLIPYMCKPYLDQDVTMKIGSGYFDCFCALQVWEHLDNQAAAFNEVMRISKSAILSFPFKWKWGDARHRGIDGKKIEQWTCGVVPSEIRIINHRAIYRWEFK